MKVYDPETVHFGSGGRLIPNIMQESGEPVRSSIFINGCVVKVQRAILIPAKERKTSKVLTN
jgi:hypothetical protein